MIAFIAAVVFTALARAAAVRVGLVDRPDQQRKIHAGATPLGGGVAVLLAVLVGVGSCALAPNLSVHFWSQTNRELIGLSLGAIFICGVGLLDDWLGLRPRQKLAGQIVACLLVMSTGLVIHNVSLFGVEVELGLLAWPLTIFWLLGAINSVNLIDGADGVAATVGIVLSFTIACMAITSGHLFEGVIALALVGSLFGFLVFNFPPATIFLGDAGSMMVGLLAGSLALRGAFKTPTSIAMLAPLAIWAVPAFDSLLAVVRRRLTGRSIAVSDRGHLHHCLLRRGYGNRQMLVWVAILCMLTSTGALISVRTGNEWYAIGSVALMITVMLTTHAFGGVELTLVANSMRNLGASILTPPWQRNEAPESTTLRLQGSRDWESLWRLALSAADDMHLSYMSLNLSLPWLHEGFHASWKSAQHARRENKWYFEIPLYADTRLVGQLKMAGQLDPHAATERAARLAEWVARFESSLAELASGAPTDRASPSTDASTEAKLRVRHFGDDATQAS
ncbi:MAG: undecaprenyl/decaprenyl-phosphate alpha-N-acetylglucosaminyl 1-phosphate transferase [Planctomycetes bacterium]|nr:undecaprenyl/decaprenyl-phosphate alpha-N-acetylglucosaminyl 1-phosphate transferase [Planctomycetota bacterium]